MSLELPRAITKPKKPRYVRTIINLPGERQISVYAGKRIRDALTELSRDMNLYHGVRFSQVLEAVYDQGMKDGARNLFEQVDGLKKTVSYRNPGAPPKKKKPASKRKKKR